MTFFKRILFVLACTLSVASAQAVGWPANYEGVMLQGFGWDTYTDTKWTNLQSQATELSQSFKLIWIPNSGHCGDGNQMGYMPQYWFTNHNSSFGTEAELLSMIKAFKAKGTGFIADVVINHRNGVTNWYDFPKEEWNGTTWSIGLEGICANDEMAYNSGQPKPTGANDTGDGFDGCRDLDHTNANVQNNCKNYCKALIEKYGYVGFRYDMVKGYGGQYNKIYNQYSKPTYSVGEYWDTNYDNVAGWIEATGKESAAFDFPGKYAINDAFASNDMTKLVWKANGTTNQPCGMIHYGYAQYAVTFVDNHDTYRESAKFSGNVVAANAFILCSPGTPCVFLPHWQQYKSEIKKLIAVRNAVGVHNCSAVTVLQSSKDCYMAEVTGSKGKLVVKIGSAMVSPTGYTSDDIKASGTDYCVWTKVTTGTEGTSSDTSDIPSKLYLLGNLSGTAGWGTTPGKGVQMTASGSTFTAKNVVFVAASGEDYCYFNLTDYVGSTWDALNAGANRYGAASEGQTTTLGNQYKINKYAKDVNASSCKSWKVPAGTYDVTADFSTMKIKLVASSTGGTTTTDVPTTLYLLGNINGTAGWGTTPGKGVKMTANGTTFTAENVTMTAASGEEYCYFNLTDYVGSTWDALNAGANRYGAASEGQTTTLGNQYKINKFAKNVNASSCKSWKVLPGKYNFTADFSTMKICVTPADAAVTVTSLSSTTGFTQGVNAVVQATVQNTFTTSKTLTVKAVLCKKSGTTYTVSATLGSASVTVSKNSTKSVSITGAVPTTLAAGTYYLAMQDGSGNLLSSYNSVEVKAKATGSADDSSLPLTISTVSTTTGFITGVKCSVKATFVNTSASAVSTKARAIFYKKSGTTYTQAAILGSNAGKALAVNANSKKTLAFEAILNASLAAGNYVLRFVDPDGKMIGGQEYTFAIKTPTTAANARYAVTNFAMANTSSVDKDNVKMDMEVEAFEDVTNELFIALIYPQTVSDVDEVGFVMFNPVTLLKDYGESLSYFGAVNGLEDGKKYTAILFSLDCENLLNGVSDVQSIDFTCANLSGVEEIELDDSDDANERARYFNLSGAEVNEDNLTPGMYIKVTRKGVSKMIVR